VNWLGHVWQKYKPIRSSSCCSLCWEVLVFANRLPIHWPIEFGSLDGTLFGMVFRNPNGSPQVGSQGSKSAEGCHIRREPCWSEHCVFNKRGFWRTRLRERLLAKNAITQARVTCPDGCSLFLLSLFFVLLVMAPVFSLTVCTAWWIIQGTVRTEPRSISNLAENRQKVLAWALFWTACLFVSLHSLSVGKYDD
jgi:hypothetical protein